MKLILAFIQPHKLNDVKKQLYQKAVYRISVTTILGCGQQRGYMENWRGKQEDVKLLQKIRLEIAVNDDFVQRAIDAIIVGAWTGEIGDGKILVLPMPECIRIRTGQKGPVAIG